MQTIEQVDLRVKEKEILSSLLRHKDLRAYFKFEDQGKFVESLTLREMILLKLILIYKTKRPYLVVNIKKPEYKRFLKGDFSIPIDICIILVRSGIYVQIDEDTYLCNLHEEDYLATWSMLNKLKGKCNFIVFPVINEEN